MLLLVRALALENDVAGQTILDEEAELGLVEHVFLRPEVDLDGLGPELLFVFVLFDGWHNEALGYFTQRL